MLCYLLSYSALLLIYYGLPSTVPEYQVTLRPPCLPCVPLPPPHHPIMNQIRIPVICPWLIFIIIMLTVVFSSFLLSHPPSFSFVSSSLLCSAAIPQVLPSRWLITVSFVSSPARPPASSPHFCWATNQLPILVTTAVCARP